MNPQQSICTSTGEWVNKHWCTGTTEYFSGIKRNKLLIHATMWMILQCILPSKRSPEDYVLYESICMTLWKMQNYRDGKQMGGCLWLGEGKELSTQKPHKKNFRVMELFCMAILCWQSHASMYLFKSIKLYSTVSRLY